MNPGTALIELPLLALTLAAIVYCGLSLIAAADFFSGREPRNQCSGELPPATILVPIAETEAGDYETYRGFCVQDYPEYQVLFSANDALNPAIPVVRRIIEELNIRNVEIVISGEVVGRNAKVNNLENALRKAKYNRVVTLDSDIRIGPDYLRNIIPLLSDSRVGLVTCLYRSAGASSFAAKIESAGLTTEFAPGVLVARFLQGVKFALGSTMATTKERLDSIGGFRAVADYLADDYMLGNLIAESGNRIQISRYIVETLVEPSSFMDMVKHQLRWARCTRFSRPSGYFGLIMTHSTPLAILYCICDSCSTDSLILLGLALGFKMAAGWLIGVHWLQDQVLQRSFWIIPLCDIFNFLIWCWGLAGKHVEWRQQILQIDRGKIVGAAGAQQRMSPGIEIFTKLKAKLTSQGERP